MAVQPLGENTATIIVNTLAACFGGFIAMLANWAYTGSVSVEMVINGMLRPGGHHRRLTA
jgi:ammonia channel protein AmtB